MTARTDVEPGDQVVREVPTARRGDRGWPVLGRTLDYARDPLVLMRELYAGYGPVAPLPLPGTDAVMILGPDACQQVLVNRERAWANEPGWTRIIGPFFTRGLMLMDFEEHHAHRRIMQEAFTRARLEAYAGRMGPAVATGLAGWEPRPGFSAYWQLKQLTLDIAADIFMGGAEDTDPVQMERINRAFVACVQAAAGIVRGNVPFTRWGRGHRGRRVLEDFLRAYLPSRRTGHGDDLFSVLCHIETDDGERFSDTDVVNHMVFLMMAAHDTSTATCSAMLQFLGQHPDWQERCREESLALGDLPSLAELESLTSLDLVMRETLRLRPPVPVVMRTAVADTVVQGVRVPAGTPAIVGVQLSHHLDDLWSEPERFDPERFAEPRREDRGHRFAWEPFGGGVHKCIGLHFAGAEIKTILHQLLRGYEWSVDPGYTAPLDHHSLPFPTDGQPIDLRTR